MAEEKKTPKPLFDHGGAPVYVMYPEVANMTKEIRDAFESHAKFVGKKPMFVPSVDLDSTPSSAILHAVTYGKVRRRQEDGTYSEGVEVHVSAGNPITNLDAINASLVQPADNEGAMFYVTIRGRDKSAKFHTAGKLVLCIH